jgi:hypothetical protein
VFSLSKEYPPGALFVVIAGVGLAAGLAVKLSDVLGSPWPLAVFGVSAATFIGVVLVIAAGLLLRALPMWPQIPVHAFVFRRALRTLGTKVHWWQWPCEDLGVVDGLLVRLSRPHLGAPGRPLRISVTGIPSHVELQTEGLRQRMSKALGTSEIMTGDPVFDRKLFIKARPGSRVLAMLDADTRQAILSLVERWNLTIAHGQVRLETRRALTSGRALAAAVRAAVSLALRPAWRRNALNGLVENAERDPLPEVRLANLAAVRRDSGRGLKALRAALSDPDERIRARAALWLGKEGRATLLELVGSPTLDSDCAADVVRTVHAQLSEERSLAILTDASRLNRRPVVLALIEGLEARGSVASVPTLRAIAAEHPLDLGLRHAAQQATAQVQSRLSGAEAGQLAVADGDSGGLSLSDACAGRLSVEVAAPSEDALDGSGQQVGADRQRRPE